jgi:cation diffusion facilitator family transporter
MTRSSENATTRSSGLPGRDRLDPRLPLWAAIINVLLAIAKIVSGMAGNSYALIADGIESIGDVISSLVVWGGLRISLKPADENHPFGHGKAETVSGVFVSIILLLTAGWIAYESITRIITPHTSPESFTLVVLIGVVIVKELLYRRVVAVAKTFESTSLHGDAWHHRSDALTSAAAAVGISVALIGGDQYASADDWAALVACLVIFWNGIRILRLAIGEVMDASVPLHVLDKIRSIAAGVDGVVVVEKCRVRKSGMGMHVDIHIQVQATQTVAEGHRLAHLVKDHLLHSPLSITDVSVHVEPHQ